MSKGGKRYARSKAREWAAAFVINGLDAVDTPVDEDSQDVQDEFRREVCRIAKRLWPATATAHQYPPERK